MRGLPSSAPPPSGLVCLPCVVHCVYVVSYYYTGNAVFELGGGGEEDRGEMKENVSKYLQRVSHHLYFKRRTLRCEYKW